jgi:predicted dehydrogenase
MSQHTRREFLEKSLLAAAAAALAEDRSMPSVHAEGPSTSPNERLRIAIVGTGSRGNEHVRFISRRKDCEIVAVCDADEAQWHQRATAIEKAAGKRPTYVRDLRRLFDDNSIHAVSVATPNHWHALAAIWAMQAGKDVYLEKPVGHNVSEGRRLVEAARKYGRICQTATQTRSSPGTRELMQFLHSGAIGEIKLARNLCYKERRSIGPRGTYNAPATVDYDLWCGPAAMNPPTRRKFHYDWHWQWEYGNGEIGNQGPHQMDVARWGMQLTGLADSVMSYGGRLGYEDAGETANTQISLHEFGDRAILFDIRGLPTERYQGTVVGTFFDGTKGWALHGGRKRTVSEEDGYDGSVVFDGDGAVVRTFKGIGFSACDEAHFGNFVAAVRSRKREDLHADIAEGHLSTGLCHLGNISYRLGETLPAGEVKKRLEQTRRKEDSLGMFELVQQHLRKNQLDPETTPLRLGAQLALNGHAEVFVGQHASEANTLLTRAYRKGFEVPAAGQLA